MTEESTGIRELASDIGISTATKRSRPMAYQVAEVPEDSVGSLNQTMSPTCVSCCVVVL